MRNLLRVEIVLFLMVSAIMPTVWATGITQQEMNQGAYDNFKQVDNELNTVYNQILTQYQADKEFIAKFTDAELAWMAFRDAELEALYPEKQDKPWKYGSYFPTAFANEKSKLTRARVKQLQEWLEGMPVASNTDRINSFQIAGSQDQMQQCIESEFKRADAALNDVYIQILNMDQPLKPLSQMVGGSLKRLPVI